MKSPEGTNKEVVRKYYNKHFKEGGERIYYEKIKNYKKLLDYLDAEKGKNLIDIGCGVGVLLKNARDRGLNVFGLDFSIEALKIAKKFTDADVILGDAENLPVRDSSFDYVTCIGSLEHFSDMRKALQEMKRILKKDGKLLIIVPNSDFLIYKIRKFRGKPVGTGQPKESLMNLRDWKRLIEQNGFKIIKVKHLRHLWDKSTFVTTEGFKEVLWKMFYKVLAFLTPPHLTYEFAFVCEKEE